jgi:hypothetical protein
VPVLSVRTVSTKAKARILLLLLLLLIHPHRERAGLVGEDGVNKRQALLGLEVLPVK